MKLGVNSYIVREISGKGFSLDDLRVDFIELGFDDSDLVENGEIQQEALKNLSGLGWSSHSTLLPPMGRTSQ